MKLNCLVILLSFAISLTASAEDLWKTLYKCKNGRDSISLMIKDASYRLFAEQCLDSSCYLISRSYDHYDLVLIELGRYEGDGLSLTEDENSKSVKITVTKGNLPQNIYSQCSL